MVILKTLTVVPIATVLTACSAMTTISTSQPGATVAIAKLPGSAAPRTESFATTSFGNYEFRAEAPGHEPFYGILPLKFNGGYLAADILLFAPAAFFNLREVFAFYEFDLAAKQIRYRQKEADEWTAYTPLEPEKARAKLALGPK